MSHVVTIRTEVKDRTAVEAACRRLQLPPPIERSVRLYSSTATGLTVELPDWRYPVVCNLHTGQVRYDHFEGRWGELSELHRFLQAYAVERTRLEAHKAGHTVTEQSLPDGSIKLTLQVGG